MKPVMALVLLCGLVVLASMQNCSEVNFSGQSGESSKLGDPDPSDPPPELPPELPPEFPPICPGGQTYDGTRCVPFSEVCASFQELTGDPIVVPARDGSGVCYYLKLINHKALVSSSQYPNMRMDIEARPHDPTTTHPRIMDTKTINELRILGTREIVLSGAFDGSARVRVDNFFLVETEFVSQGQLVKKLFGQGTADAPKPGQPLTVGGQEVVYVPGLASGTDIIDPVDLALVTPLQMPVKFRVSALDCGSVGETSDIFVLFR